MEMSVGLYAVILLVVVVVVVLLKTATVVPQQSAFVIAPSAMRGKPEKSASPPSGSPRHTMRSSKERRHDGERR